MANLETDLRTALVAALRADTTFASVLGNSGTVHVEGGDQPDSFHEGATGRAYVRAAGRETLEEYEDSKRVRYRFTVHIQLVDIRGQANALAKAGDGLNNALRDKGSVVFTTYFTDSNSNRLGGSGEWSATDFTPMPLEGVEDPDRPEIVAEVVCELWQATPLVTT